MRTHEQTVQDQFDPRAQAYLSSAVHAAGPDLEQARSLTERTVASTAEVLDVGCGAGHLSFALAPCVARVVALDPSSSMLATVTAGAAARGLNQIEVRQASAQSLPFPDGAFSLVCSRYSAHHWRGLEVALREMCRVIAPGGHALIIDALGNEDALVDTYLQALELLRDPSHVRDRSKREWRALLESAGLDEIEHAQWPVRLEFASWTQRMRVPPARSAAIRSLQEDAPEEVREALVIETDGSFTIRTGLFWLRKPG